MSAIEAFLNALRQSPIIASVQAPPGSPLDDPATIARLAQASLSQGARVLRLEGVQDIVAGRHQASAVVGLIKRQYSDSPVYITPTLQEVGELADLPLAAIAFDATRRARPGGVSLRAIVSAIHAAGKLAWADCDSVQAALDATDAGSDLVSTTLFGYTGGVMTAGPDLEGLRELIRACRIPVIAEGRFSQEWEVRAALQMGAAGVVVGGALNDPIKQTARFLRAARTPKTVAAFDIGGTWLRFGLFEHWKLVQAERAPLPADPLERLGWMRDRLDPTLERVGISSGGTVDPTTNKVIEAKPIIPNHVGTHFKFGDVPVVALNDGLATAWGHACHPNFAGRRVATLALGTGLGFGLVDRGRLLRGPRGQYPRLNDAPASQNKSFEDLLGGAALTDSPTDGQIAEARHAANAALDLIRSLYLPDEIVLCGGVGFAPWLDLNLPRSPFGADAGLYGAAALALWPPMD